MLAKWWFKFNPGRSGREREAKPLLNVRLINCGLKLAFSYSPGVFLLSVKTSSVNNKTAEKLSVRNTGREGKGQINEFCDKENDVDKSDSDLSAMDNTSSAASAASSDISDFTSEFEEKIRNISGTLQVRTGHSRYTDTIRNLGECHCKQ